MLYRAVLAHESGRTDEFERLFQAARDAFAEATRLESGKDGVAAVVGGSFSVFSDRLPAEHRTAAWSQAYDAYALLWQEQEAILDKLPVHHQGELLGGLAQSAQRTGRVEEAAEHVDRMLTVLQDTPYEATARRWKSDPASAAGTTLTCKYCHNAGRLSARLAALKQ